MIDITKSKLLEEELTNRRDQSVKKVDEQTKDLKISHDHYQALYETSKKAEALHRSLLNASVDAVVIYDLHRCVKYLSPSFTRIFGWNIDELEGKNIPFIPPGEKEEWLGKLHQLVENGETIHNHHTRRFTQAGALLDVYISASLYTDHADEPAGILLNIKDVTQAKEIELQFYRAQKFEISGTLAGGIAHNFNNLLMGMQGNISLLTQDTDLLEKHIQRLGNIEKNIQRGGNLTKQLLGLAKGGQYEEKSVNINNLLWNCMDMFGQSRRDIIIRPNLLSDISIVKIDEGQIEQVFLNLFVNAAQAMPTGGDLYIKTENTILNQKEADRFGCQSGMYVQVSVADTGGGIAPDVMDKIFDPFFTTKDKELGTGLGLASAYGIVKNHAGLIQVRERSGGGAEFTVYLPATDEPMVKENTVPQKLERGNETILLVDDEETVLEVTEQILLQLGYTVIIARSGQAAVDYYSKCSNQIDLVILDMVMPGLSGVDVFKKISAFNSEVRVLLSSGYSISGHAAEILASGSHVFIQKPFSIQDISQKVRELLESS